VRNTFKPFGAQSIVAMASGKVFAEWPKVGRRWKRT